MPNSRRITRQNEPKTPTTQKAVPLPQVGDVSPVELKAKKADARKSVKQKPKQQQPQAAVKREPIPDRGNLFDRALPYSFPAYLCDTDSNVERGEADPLPPPSALFAAYCRSKALEQAKRRRPVSPQGPCTTTRQYHHHFVPLTNEPAFATDCDGAGVGPVIGTFSLINKRGSSMKLLPVHQRGRQMGVMTTTRALAELGLAKPNAGTSIVDLLARSKADHHLQVNLVIFSRANIVDSVVSRFPFPVSAPEGGFTISSAVVAVSQQSSNQVPPPELFYSEQIEVFGFPSDF